jgi:very-short-patch-repair endonuclease
MDWTEELVRVAKTRCESPIEEMFAEAWVYECDPAPTTIGGSPEQFLADYPETTPTTPLHVWQKNHLMQQVRIGDYRVDFVLGRVDSHWLLLDGEPKEVLVRLPLVIVECDGHDFHEKTKEQAQRDKSRDRYLTSQGYRVLRFTGSEIYRDAEKCAKEVAALFRCLLNPELAKMALKFFDTD